MSLPARVGRDRQRYEDNLRLVSGCIPYRILEDENDRTEKRIEVLMVTSPNRNDLVFPKGGWEDDETVEEAACREAYEEAGVKGMLSDPIGIWEFRSKSSQEEDCSSPVGGCRGHMFMLEVAEELDAWPEQENRSRRWVTVKEAFKLCRYEWMQQALVKFISLLDADVRDEPFDGLVESSSDAYPIVPSSNCCADHPTGSQSHCIVPVTWLVVPVESETFA